LFAARQTTTSAPDNQLGSFQFGFFSSATLQRLAAFEVTIFAESSAQNTPKARFKV
jgi:hypothetical protein